VFGEIPPPIPNYRFPGLKFIFYVREAQNKASEEYLERYNNFFNVTMSFKLDADKSYCLPIYPVLHSKHNNIPTNFK